MLLTVLWQGVIKMIEIDGKQFNVIIPQDGIKRNFIIKDGGNGDFGVQGNMIRDVVGTYYNYTVTIYTNNLSRNEYDSLYNIISSPVDFHTVKVPFAQGWLTYQVYITEGTDTLLKQDKRGNHWHSIDITFNAAKPQRRC